MSVKSANAMYEKRFKSLKLPPRIVAQLKEMMSKVEGDGNAVKQAARVWLKKRGYGSGSTSSTKSAKPEKKEAKKEKETTTTSPAPAFLVKHGAKVALKGDPERGVPKDNIDMSKLDRPTLKGMAKDLGVAYDREMSDDALREAVSNAMIKSEEALSKLESVDPAKVGQLPDCIGLFIDLTKAACIACPLQKDCRDLFEKNRQQGFVRFDALLKNKPLPESKKKEEKATGFEVTITTYDKDQKTKVVETKTKIKELPEVKANGIKVSDHSVYRELIRQVEARRPATVGEVREIILENYDPDENTKEARKKLVSFYLAYLQATGVVTLVY